jgi:hypothetical protein
VQELLRHSSIKVTMDVYTQAVTATKRQAQSKVVLMIVPRQSMRQETTDLTEASPALGKWIVPRWGDYLLPNIKAVEVELWLKHLERAAGTCCKIRNVMSVLFNHARRYDLFWQSCHFVY